MFMLPLEEPQVAGCVCCDPAIMEWHLIARSIEPGLSRRFLKADGIVDEDGEDAFLDDELKIASALSLAWMKRGAKARELLLASTASGNFIPNNFQSAVDEATPFMSTVFDDAADKVEKAVASTIATGEAQILSGVLREAPTAKLFEQGIVNATRYYTNKYFNTVVVPDIIKAIDAINAQHTTSAPTIESIQAAISKHFKSVPYWEMVANVAASRGYHYGMLKTMEMTSVIGYRFVAVIDGRTSKVCRAMNGREFLVAEAVNVLEGLAEDPDPEAAKTRTPWLSARDITGKSNADLASLGFMIPPLHPRCRSTIQPIY